MLYQDCELVSQLPNYMLSHIARLVNEGFYENGGSVRAVPVTIGGSSYVPPIPNELDVKERIDEIINLVLVKVAASKHFIHWIMALGEGAKIIGPESLVKGVQDEIRRLAEQYNN